MTAVAAPTPRTPSAAQHAPELAGDAGAAPGPAPRSYPHIPPVFAHRGGWGEAPQNTAANLRAAAAAGANLEYDVRRTADGVLVVHHDPDVGGITLFGRRFGGTPIAGLRFDQLPAERRGYPVPTLQEALEIGVSTGRAQLVETKEHGYEADVLAAARSAGVRPGDLLIQSFLPDSVRAVKQLAPEIPAGLLLQPDKGDPSGAHGIGVARVVRADFVLPRSTMTTDAFLDAAAAAHLPVVTWTPWRSADAARSAELLADPRVAGVITNERDAAVSAAAAVPWRHDPATA